MTEETSSSSSTFGKQDMGHLLKYIGNRTIPLLPPVPLHPRLLRVVESGANLQIPEDILEIVRKFVGWDNLGDVSRAWEKYTFISQGHEYPNFDIKEELEKLKGLSSALGSKYDVYAKEYEKIKIEYEDHFSRLAEQLVEQVPRIKYMPGYEHLTTETEKFHIEKALRKKVQEVEVEDLDLARHLKDWRRKRMTMDRKCEEVYEPLGRVGRLRSRVNNFIQILTATEQSRLDKTATEQSRLDKRLDDWVVSEAVNGNKKRKCFGIPAKNKKLVDRKEVEDGLLKVLKEVGGKTLESSAVSTEFRMKWDSIVDDFTILLDYF